MAFELGRHQVEIDRLDAGLEENGLPAIAALGHVMGDAGNDLRDSLATSTPSS